MGQSASERACGRPQLLPVLFGRGKTELASAPLISALGALAAFLPGEAAGSRSVARAVVRRRSRARVQQRPKFAGSG